MAQSTVIEVDFCYSLGKLAFKYERSHLSEPADLIQLNRYSKAELIDLVSQMVDYEPDLERLIQLPNAGGSDSPSSLDQKAIERQIRYAFHKAAGQWGAAYALSLELLDLVKLGDNYLQQQQWKDAVTVYQTIVEETLEHEDLIDDNEGDLSIVINRSVAGLHKCFQATAEPALRQTILNVLSKTYPWDVDENSL
jgi:hypothetical protein